MSSPKQKEFVTLQELKLHKLIDETQNDDVLTAARMLGYMPNQLTQFDPDDFFVHSTKASNGFVLRYLAAGSPDKPVYKFAVLGILHLWNDNMFGVVQDDGAHKGKGRIFNLIPPVVSDSADETLSEVSALAFPLWEQQIRILHQLKDKFNAQSYVPFFPLPDKDIDHSMSIHAWAFSRLNNTHRMSPAAIVSFQQRIQKHPVISKMYPSPFLALDSLTTTWDPTQKVVWERSLSGKLAILTIEFHARVDNADQCYGFTIDLDSAIICDYPWFDPERLDRIIDQKVHSSYQSTKLTQPPTSPYPYLAALEKARQVSEHEKENERILIQTKRKLSEETSEEDQDDSNHDTKKLKKLKIKLLC